jgi:hypothetical protein
VYFGGGGYCWLVYLREGGGITGSWDYAGAQYRVSAFDLLTLVGVDDLVVFWTRWTIGLCTLDGKDYWVLYLGQCELLVCVHWLVQRIRLCTLGGVIIGLYTLGGDHLFGWGGGVD